MVKHILSLDNGYSGLKIFRKNLNEWFSKLVSGKGYLVWGLFIVEDRTTAYNRVARRVDYSKELSHWQSTSPFLYIFCEEQWSL